MGYRLGVDLGTTWTAAGAHDGTAVTAVVLGAHGPALPSVIAFDGEEVLIGETAARRLITDPTSGAREMKRRLGDTTPFVLQGTPYTAEALMGRILGHVVSVAGITFGGPPDEVVLTHPATWGEFKLDLLREAGRVAGLNEVELMAEPSAAAAHYARTGKVAADGLVGVYDFGGGTFDAAVLQGSGGRFDVVGKAEGLDRLGGIDLDQAVIAHVDQSLDGALRNLDREDPDVRQALAELRDACVAAKEALSVNSEVAIPVVVPGLSTEVRLTRAEFEAAIRPRLTETLDAFDRTVAAAGVEVAALDVVLLVGGSSRIPLVAEMLAAHTGRPMALDTDTKAAVSLGAAGWSAAAGVAGGAGAAAAVAVAAAVVGSPDTASAAPAAAGPAAGKAREKRGSATDAGTKGSPGGGRAARVAAGGAAAAAVVAAGGGAAYAASAGGATRPSLADADDADDADSDEPATTTGIDPITGESESLDAFDEVAGPAIDHPVALAGDDAGPGDRFRGGSGDGAPARAADPDDGPDRGGPTQDERVDAIQDSLRARLAAWKPPPGADPEEVDDLRAELEGRIDRFDPADGVDFENAAGDLQQALDDSLEDFQQSEQLDKTEQMTGRLAQEEQREAADDAEEIEDKNGFIEYQGALSTFVQAWKPNFSPWIDGQDMVDFQKDLIGSTIGGRPFDPDRPLRGQQMALEQVVRNKLSAFEHEQYESHYRSESDRLAAAMQAEVNILNNPASSAEAKAAAASYIDTLNIQRQTIENLHNGFRGTESPPDPALDAALHAHLEPALSEMTFTEVAVDDSSRGALFALAADADGADDAEAPGGVFASVDADVSALAAEHVHALSDVFDDVATAEAAPLAVVVPTVSDESQMTGGGPPLPPGIRTMAADTSALSVDPLEDDALGVAVEATAVRIAEPAPSPVAASTFAPVGPDLGDPDDVLEPVLRSAAADLPDPISGPMADGSEDLPEDDSPNPLDDLDDPLDPSLP